MLRLFRKSRPKRRAKRWGAKPLTARSQNTENAVAQANAQKNRVPKRPIDMEWEARRGAKLMLKERRKSIETAKRNMRENNFLIKSFEEKRRLTEKQLAYYKDLKQVQPHYIKEYNKITKFWHEEPREEICKKRKEIRKQIMKQTGGKGLSIKKANWDYDSIIRCKKG